MKLALVSAVAAFGLLHSAFASTRVPTVAGDYVATTRIFCQPVVQVTHSNGAVSSVILNNDGLTTYSIDLEYFDPRTTLYTAIGFSEKGTAVMLSDDVNGPSGTPFNETPDQDIFFYSNTATTLTLNGITYSATWGHEKNTVLFKHVPEYFSLLGIDANGCVIQSDHMRR
jgi:hypothetical protein